MNEEPPGSDPERPSRAAARKERGARRRGGWKGALVAGGHLAVLWTVAVAQPLLDLLGRNAEFFVAHGTPPREIVGLALVLTFAPPAFLLAVELLAGLLGSAVRALVHVVFVGALVALVVLQVGKRATEDSGRGLLVAAVLAGVGLALAYARVPALRFALTVLMPVPLVVVGLFLFQSDVSRLVVVDEPEAKAADVSARTPVVLVVFDELPTVSLMNGRGDVDASRYPSFAALASDSTWFRSATTVNSTTHLAVPAILTGRVAGSETLPVLADHPNNAFTLLADDYELRAIEAVSRLCPPGRCVSGKAEESVSERVGSLGADVAVVYLHLVVPDELGEDLPPVGQTWSNFLGDEDEDPPEEEAGERLLPTCGRSVCRFAESIGPTRRPSFYFLHSMLPHVPWLYLPSGRRYVHDVRLIPGTDGLHWGSDEWLLRQAYQRYLLQLGYTDRALGVILERLRAARLYDRALVVVTADHGLDFDVGESRRNAAPETLDGLAFVPLFVKVPGQRDARVVDTLARTIDVLPTIADVLGVSIPWRVHGRSLMGTELPRDGVIELRDETGARFGERLSSLLVKRRQALARQIAWFGDGGGFDPVYRIGPNPSLLGKAVSTLRVRQSDVRVELTGDRLFLAVDTTASWIPTYITGSFAAQEGPVELAVGVNGRIAAVTSSYPVGAEQRFAALVPDDALISGSNDVRVYAVGEGTEPVLAELRGVELSFTLAPADRPSRIEASGGDRVRIASGVLSGELRVHLSSETAVLQGWAADLRASRPAERLIVFVDGKSVYAGPLGNARAAPIEKRYGIVGAGFHVELPVGLVPERGADATVRVFAVRGNAATELPYRRAYPWRTG